MRGSIYKVIAILVLGSLLVVSATAEVYKWTDEQGRIHYSDKAQDDAIQFDIQTGEKSTVSPPDSAQRRENTRRLLRAFEEERRINQEKQHKQQVQESRQVRHCAEARDQLKRYTNARALYDFDNQGKRYILSEEQRRQAEARTAGDVQRWCD